MPYRSRSHSLCTCIPCSFYSSLKKQGSNEILLKHYSANGLYAGAQFSMSTVSESTNASFAQDSHYQPFPVMITWKKTLRYITWQHALDQYQCFPSICTLQGKTGKELQADFQGSLSIITDHLLTILCGEL